MDAKTTRRRQLYRYIQLLALFAVFVGTSTASWAETRYMFDTDSLTADIARLDADSVQLSNIDRLTSQPATKGFEAARLSKDFIQSMNKNDSINVNIFGKYIPMTIKDYQDRGDGSIVHASNSDTGAHMMLHVQGNNLTGSIRDGDDLYNLQSLGNNLVGITLVDESQLQEHSTNYPTGAMEPSEGKPIQLQKNNSSDSFNLSLEDSAGTIRVMVAYTPAASAAVTNINSTIALAIAETNQSYANSGVNTRLKLAHSYQTAYTETGSMSTDLERIRTSSDGHMDEVHSLRNTHAADIVILMGSNNYSYCGLASTIMATEASAFAIVRISCATGYYSFAHEVGHLQGARHIISNDSSIVPFAYGHGYCQPGVSNGWRTVMAYHCPDGDGTRIPYWSNPHKLYSDVAMGVVGTSNNARVLNETTGVLNETADVLANSYTSSMPSIASHPRQPIGHLYTNSPCTLSQGATKCNVTLTVRKENIPIACIWRTQPSLALFSCGGSRSWSTIWPWTNINRDTMQLRAHNTYPALDPNWPGSVQQVFNAALLLDEKIVMAKPYTPRPPNLISGQTTCYDNYCIRLTGTYFQSDAYVAVRPRNSPGIIGYYRGSDLIRGSNGNIDTLQLRITDPTQRNHLNSTGLRFYVVNPGNSWDGPVHIKRRLSCFPFCGGPIP